MTHQLPKKYLELGLLVWRFVDVGDAFLHHFGDGLFQLTSLFRQSENVFVEKIPIFLAVT